MTKLQVLKEQLAALKKLSYSKPPLKIAAGWKSK